MGCKLYSETKNTHTGPFITNMAGHLLTNQECQLLINMKEEVKVLDPAEAMIATQLDKFEFKEEELQVIVKEYDLLVISGVNDKAGRKAVGEARKHLKRIRNSISTDSKNFRENFNKVSKAIIAREKEFISITSPGEDRLERMELDITEEEEELERIRLYEEQELIVARTKELDRYGASFNGIHYELGDNIITVAEIRLFTETEFARKMAFFQEDYENYEQLKLQAAIDEQVFLKSLFDKANNYLLLIGRSSDFPHEAFKSHEELNLFLIRVDNQVAKEKQDFLDAEVKRIAAETLKAEQARLSEIDKQQKAQQAELDRKQKDLNDQLALIQKQKDDAAEKERVLNQKGKIENFNTRRAILLSDPTFVNSEIADDANHQIYTFEDEKWNTFLQLSRDEYKAFMTAEDALRVEMEPDVDVLKGIVDTLRKSMSPKPAMKTAKGIAVLNNINELKTKTINYIEDQIKNI